MSSFFRRLLGLPAKQVGGDGSVQIQAGGDLYVERSGAVRGLDDFELRIKQAEVIEARRRVEELTKTVEDYLNRAEPVLARMYKRDLDEAVGRLARLEQDLGGYRGDKR